MSKGGSGCCDEREGGMRLRWMNNTYLLQVMFLRSRGGRPPPGNPARNHADLAVGVELRVVS